MATITQAAKEFVGSFDEAAGRIRVVNELLIDTVKKTGNASLDAYEQGLTDLINFQQQVADCHPTRLGQHVGQGPDRVLRRDQRRLHRGRPRSAQVGRGVRRLVVRRGGRTG